MMKICISYDSKFGNGKKCVEHLQTTLTKKGHKADIFDIRQTAPSALPKADIYVFSSPTHVGNAPFKVKGFLKNVKIPQEGARYALMATCMDLKCKTLKVMDERIQPKGMQKATEDLLIKVTGIKGPLEDDYEKKVEAFASKLVAGK